MECRLTRSPPGSPWSCKVYIRWEYDSSGTKRDEVSEEAFGSIISDPADVEMRLRKAQAAVLNPHIPLKDVLDKTEDEIGELNAGGKTRFSRNVVCVDLEGEDLTDLSFIDLPGILYTLTPR
jgi:hypothetical protein